jgi:RNA polymerase sigma-70 factor (ECF subfamily)
MKDLPEFYNLYVDKVYKFFYIKCLNRQIAEDLTSQTFTLFIEQSNHQQINDNKKYLYGIMRNTWLQFLRNKYQESILYIESIEDFEDYSESEINEYEEIEKPILRIRVYVEKLPAKQRQIVEMRIFENLSVGETAARLNKDKNYVKTTYKRGLISLRNMLTAPYLEYTKDTL